MAIVMMEGFDHSSKEAKGWSLDGDTLATGRVNGKCLRFTGTSADAKYCRGFLPTALTEFTLGFAFKSDRGVGSGYGSVIQLKTVSAGKYDTPAGYIYITNAGAVGVGASGGGGGAGAPVVTTSSWVYIEVHVKVAGSSGTVSIRVNGGPYLATVPCNFGSSALQMIELWNDTHDSGAYAYYDDIYATDITGTLNGFLGDCHVETILPDGVGASSMFIPLSGANWTNVDEKPPDDDTSYVSSTTVNDIDTYSMANLTLAGGVVLGVKTNLYAKKDDAGFRQLAAVYRQGGSNFVGTALTLSASYAMQSEIRELNPATGVPWTLAEINANEFGAKLIA